MGVARQVCLRRVTASSGERNQPRSCPSSAPETAEHDAAKHKPDAPANNNGVLRWRVRLVFCGTTQGEQDRAAYQDSRLFSCALTKHFHHGLPLFHDLDRPADVALVLFAGVDSQGLAEGTEKIRHQHWPIYHFRT